MELLMPLGNKFMQRAILLSVKNVEKGGGPFGAVIVKGGKIIAEGVNRVTTSSDPTAHAEVNAIRKASRKLGTFDLTGCEIYTSCEPCPMCLGAIYWAHIGRLFYGNSKTDAEDIGFSDAFIYNEIALEPDRIKLQAIQMMADEASEAFVIWMQKEDKIKY